MEITSVIIGALLGFLSSILTIIIQRVLDRKGKLQIYYRITNSIGFDGGWGFEKESQEEVDFVVPVVYEIQNLSNTTRVIRDVSVLLYKDEKKIKKMTQLNHVHRTSKSGNTITKEEDFFFGTDKGSYSFVIPPRSIQRQECEYLIILHKEEVNADCFNNIRIRYYDERNKEKLFKVRNIDLQKLITFPIDDEWVLLK